MGRGEPIHLAVVFGGRSPEHPVSLVSARHVLAHLEGEDFVLHPVGIARDGAWHLGEDARRLLEGHAPEGPGGPPRLPEETDCVFPLVHGPGGEDGSLQGYLETLGLPFVGSGSLGSALAMDKVVSKRVFRDASIPVVNGSEVSRREWRRDPGAVLRRVLQERGLPAFVKPAALGSSVGIHRCTDEGELRAGLEDALGFGPRALVEPALRVRELEIAILDGEPPLVSPPGEIVPRDWYDYRAKYEEDSAELRVPAPDLPPRMVEHLQELAWRAFRALRLRGLARVDFFLDRDRGRPALNEVNTLPGFTRISMYPRLMEHCGVPPARLCRRLVALALREARDLPSPEPTPRAPV